MDWAINPKSLAGFPGDGSTRQLIGIVEVDVGKIPDGTAPIFTPIVHKTLRQSAGFIVRPADKPTIIAVGDPSLLPKIHNSLQLKITREIEKGIPIATLDVNSQRVSADVAFEVLLRSDGKTLTLGSLVHSSHDGQ